MKKKIAIFSGSFNPIHIGHLALANYICEQNWVDELWFMVTPHNPLKSIEYLLPDSDRLEMVKLAIHNYPRFKASDFEFNLPQPSYSINTLNKLREVYPDYEFFLVIGADNWAVFDKWKSADDIIHNYNLLIYPRPGYKIDNEKLPHQVHYINTPQLEVSSTFIRNSFKEGKDMRYFLHPAVYQYIIKKNLFSVTE